MPPSPVRAPKRRSSSSAAGQPPPTLQSRRARSSKPEASWTPWRRRPDFLPERSSTIDAVPGSWLRMRAWSGPATSASSLLRAEEDLGVIPRASHLGAGSGLMVSGKLLGCWCLSRMARMLGRMKTTLVVHLTTDVVFLGAESQGVAAGGGGGRLGG